MCLTRPATTLEFDKWAAHVEDRVGRIPLMGRYHVAPRSISDDYKPTAKVLGKGCSGPVRMATSVLDHKKKFAVKSFTLGNLKEIELAHLKGELATSLCLDHPNVARLADVYESEHELYLVTECIEGGELLQRLLSKKRFSEQEAAVAMRQVLQALSYVHSQGIVHRDLKLENFLYSSEGGDHLKLIDFGFSKFFSRAGGRRRMNSTCGTLSYLAPEVLVGDYCGSTCDMWSAGVIAFVLLSGSMPFHGAQEDKVKSIYHGKYNMKPEAWDPLSEQAREFTKGLLNTNPKDRLTAKSALAHPWLQEICKAQQPMLKDPHHIVDSLASWKSMPKLRRACLTMLSWSLSEDERLAFRDQFLALDSDHNGAISYAELKKAIVENSDAKGFNMKEIFEELARNADDEIHYSDFVAALMSQRVEKVDDSLLKTAFRRFDQHSSGYITPENFSNVVGLEYEGVTSTSLLLEADTRKPGDSIDLKDFVEYMRPSNRTKLRETLSPLSKPNVSRPKLGKTAKQQAWQNMNEEKAAQQQCCTLM